jgi:hypothetical protein
MRQAELQPDPAVRLIGQRLFAQLVATGDKSMFYNDLNDFVQSAIILLCGGALCAMVGRRLNLKTSLVVLLFIWHTIFATYYAYYIMVNGGDAFSYFMRAKYDYVRLDFGTEFVVWITSLPVSLGMTYWPASFLYHGLGALGLTFYYAALSEAGAFEEGSWLRRLVATLCLLLPSLSFWTSGIGKDSIAFLSVGMFLWATIRIDRRQPIAVLAVLVMFGIRPHIAALMVMSVAAGTIFIAEVRASIRFSAAALATAGAVFAVPLALAYAGTTQFTTLAEYISDRQEENLGGGSSVDITTMNPAMRLLSFLYRPLPNEASGLDQLAASLDNLFLIALTVIGLIVMYRAGFIRSFRRHSIALMYGVGGVILLSQVTANLGLATRQKWMMIPALMLVVLSTWRMARKDEVKKQPFRHYPHGSAQAMR